MERLVDRTVEAKTECQAQRQALPAIRQTIKYPPAQAALIELLPELQWAKVQHLDGEVLPRHAVGAAVHDAEGAAPNLLVQGVETGVW